MRPDGRCRDARGRSIRATSRGCLPVATLAAGVANAFADRVSVSVHVYGDNIGAVRRATFDPDTGAERPFISGYANAAVPNLWDRSANPAAQ